MDARPPLAEIRRDFGLDIDVVTPWPVGFESQCWIADDRWFIKVWRDRTIRSTSRFRPPWLPPASRCQHLHESSGIGDHSPDTWCDLRAECPDVE